MSVILKDITKKYREQVALDKVSFEIVKTEIVGLIGPNGAGKSTLMKIITGIISADEGEVLVTGMSDIRKIKKIIGYLPENNPLYQEMYIKEYLEYVADHYKDLRNRKKRIDEIISLTGLIPEKHKKISQLSKGFRQRVGIAQALIHDPEILILDEPTSGLDPNQIIEIRNLISELGKEKTVILSTHILQEVEAICNRVIIIGNGKILANGRPDEISASFHDETETLLVEFDSEHDCGELSQIEGIIKIAQIKKNIILIGYKKSIDIRSSVFNYAVRNNLTVLSMQKKEKSLEKVFRELTKEGMRGINNDNITGQS